MSSGPPPVGSRVRVFGLKAKPELNDRHGRVVTPLSDKGRLAVEMEAIAEGLVNVKPENLAIADVPAERAVVGENGVLLRLEGETFNTLLDTSRFLVNHAHGYVLAPMVQ
mmetsp:Transcript_29078/g.73204  ORF Transcript_29078/g.73204 Transcript_29078/m.73204 type:complete len:110 (+) Transcript_29078:64-393(+)